MSEKTLPENMKSFVAKQILHYLDEDPDKALPNLLSWADKFDKDNLFPSQRAAFHKGTHTFKIRCVIPEFFIAQRFINSHHIGIGIVYIFLFFT